MYDTSDRGPDRSLMIAIENFHTKMEHERLKQEHLDRGLKPDTNPMRPSNVWPCLFPVHPIATDSAEGASPPFRPAYFDDGCILCSEDFPKYTNAIIAQLFVSTSPRITYLRDTLNRLANSVAISFMLHVSGITGTKKIAMYVKLRPLSVLPDTKSP